MTAPLTAAELDEFERDVQRNDDDMDPALMYVTVRFARRLIAQARLGIAQPDHAIVVSQLSLDVELQKRENSRLRVDIESRNADSARLRQRIADLAKELVDAGAAERFAKAKVQVAHAARDDVWFWQGDELDDPASLTCPVVMTAETLRGMLERIAQLEAVERAAREYLRETERCRTRHLYEEEMDPCERVLRQALRAIEPVKEPE